ncbi:hypothetical protein QO002_005118 [Pararhizobium capsulatum DSM 1112]|uniref:Uncharacterized protein n=1 Tax=Pararhizobium capsulatum DSM 1112 TaxID=1121113 RepID=A0ABU0C1D2_9HYPH|nr:hypothetical protein [Pararhizobium capsulatum]MDQ0322912.1 hypothetical protein [Pararhizobium capsulatum DSM 1112]
MHIVSSRFPAAHPDRDLQCQEAIGDAVREVIKMANMRGYGTVEVLDAMDKVIKQLRQANGEDPSPLLR